MVNRKHKIIRWSVTFGILSLVALIIFVLSLKTLLMDTFSKYALWIALVSGVLLIIFIATGTLTMKSIFRKAKNSFK